jgi:hypothetical protein
MTSKLILKKNTTCNKPSYKNKIFISWGLNRPKLSVNHSPHLYTPSRLLWPLLHARLGSIFLEPKDIQSITLGAIWNFSNASGLLWLDMRHKGSVFKVLVHRSREVPNAWHTHAWTHRASFRVQFTFTFTFYIKNSANSGYSVSVHGAYWYNSKCLHVNFCFCKCTINKFCSL